MLPISGHLSTSERDLSQPREDDGEREMVVYLLAVRPEVGREKTFRDNGPVDINDTLMEQ